MRVIRILPLVAMLLSCFPFSVSAGNVPPAPEWDTVLDGIYAYTWRGQPDLTAELKKQEARIKQDLPGYIAAWEQQMSVPIVYTAKERTGSACGPLNYCGADFLDQRKLIMKLREKKEPLARFLFGKLSPEAQKTIAESDLTSANAPQLLAGELTRRSELQGKGAQRRVHRHPHSCISIRRMSFAGFARADDRSGE